MKKVLYVFLVLVLYCCSDRDDTLANLEDLNRPNCGEITRLWSQNVSAEF